MASSVCTASLKGETMVLAEPAPARTDRNVYANRAGLRTNCSSPAASRLICRSRTPETPMLHVATAVRRHAGARHGGRPLPGAAPGAAPRRGSPRTAAPSGPTSRYFDLPPSNSRDSISVRSADVRNPPPPVEAMSERRELNNLRRGLQQGAGPRSRRLWPTLNHTSWARSTQLGPPLGQAGLP